eukprot:CAMPEP_0179418462 /NCGR_PEP_ID=MMETSP0799-20121207/8018_1 /TAXON_ID=46947 /ORGANISM="Geminigera cryophila, Strain CCMP2564" /LENGTH=86 /DNA_ID=CAMNT_0021191749 /DNA_START=60 /DNA_END=320 /DNA_ORIENTATION=+
MHAPHYQRLQAAAERGPASAVVKAPHCRQLEPALLRVFARNNRKVPFCGSIKVSLVAAARRAGSEQRQTHDVVGNNGIYAQPAMRI